LQPQQALRALSRLRYGFVIITGRLLLLCLEVCRRVQSLKQRYHLKLNAFMMKGVPFIIVAWKLIFPEAEPAPVNRRNEDEHGQRD
jgi:hypothetical protein